MALLMGKCLESAMKQTINVLIPKLKFDDHFKMHFRESEQLLVHDPFEKCKPGDWILIRELKEKLSLKVNHKVEKIVYEAGNIIDPISGKKSLGYTYEDDATQQSKLFGLSPLKDRKIS